ncbi:hypothetical protein DCC85_07485 [Paenibacillus sp. CAA11]|uniref:anti-sigma factor n=1 Tax=Paenibacillus sp. CAA11 TaxID=1532905 RepID=UPI000D33C203|nr:anti-sigma factor [Paenibacillus sp. CAA11]AWB44073.1 hypothetical protein DCC85_07485 [Paenibacillus sp. CAA11]
MTEDFKARLKAYEKGELEQEEKLRMEAEFEKLEIYQAYLDELMGEETRVSVQYSQRHQGESGKSSKTAKEYRILRRGKWKMRWNTLLTMFSLFIIVWFVTYVVSVIYYSTGKPNRAELIRDVVSSAVAVTQPNRTVNMNEGSSWFSLQISGELSKRIGSESKITGEMTQHFLFSWARTGEDTSFEDQPQARGGLFCLPGKGPYDYSEVWSKLDKLPEGTVTEAYLSLDRYFSTDELLALFKGRDVDVVWMAARTGQEGASAEGDSEVQQPMGFPATPIWHEDDYTIISRQVTDKGTAVSRRSPSVDVYGSGKIRNENFLKTLKLIGQHPSMVRLTAPSVDFKAAANYVEKNGVQLYGVVITGPTKEILKLKQEKWISFVRLGESELWNWR